MKKTLLGIVCSLLLFLGIAQVLPFPAFASQTIEQQINIINNDTTTGGSSNGMVLLDTSKYTGATYYFEVIAKVTTGSGSVDLNYNAGTGVQSSGGTTITIPNITATSFTRYRSGAFTPTGAQNAHFKNLVCTGCTLTLHAVRIIIVQSDPIAITDTETQVDIGEFSNTFTNTTDTPANDTKFWKYDLSKYSNLSHIYFEATLQQNNPNSGANIAYESLYVAGPTCSQQVSGSEVSMSVNNIQRLRSGDLLPNLVNGTTYMICARTSPAGKVLEKTARVIIDQSNGSALTAMEIPQAFNIDKVTSTSTTLTGQSYNNLFESANWAGFSFTYSYQATIKSSNTTDTVTSQLCYLTISACDTVVGNSVTTSGTGFALITSGNFSQPPSGQELDIGIKTATGGDTIGVTKGELIIDVSPLSSNTPAQIASSTTQTVNYSNPDQNIKTGWKKRIHAGPNHIGIATVITAANATSPSRTAGTIISDSASHIDVFVDIQKHDPIDLPAQPTPVPFPWQQGLNIASDIYQYNAVSSFNGYPVTVFDNPVTVILSYDPEKLYGLDPSLLRIAYLDQNSNTWKVIANNTVVDTTQHIIANTTKTFSFFSVVYPASSFLIH